jgi:hypothetical protein
MQQMLSSGRINRETGNETLLYRMRIRRVAETESEVPYEDNSYYVNQHFVACLYRSLERLCIGRENRKLQQAAHYCNYRRRNR